MEDRGGYGEEGNGKKNVYGYEGIPSGMKCQNACPRGPVGPPGEPGERGYSMLNHCEHFFFINNNFRSMNTRM